MGPATTGGTDGGVVLTQSDARGGELSSPGGLVGSVGATGVSGWVMRSTMAREGKEGTQDTVVERQLQLGGNASCFSEWDSPRRGQ